MPTERIRKSARSDVDATAAVYSPFDSEEQRTTPPSFDSQPSPPVRERDWPWLPWEHSPTRESDRYGVWGEGGLNPTSLSLPARKAKEGSPLVKGQAARGALISVAVLNVGFVIIQGPVDHNDCH